MSSVQIIKGAKKIFSLVTTERLAFTAYYGMRIFMIVAFALFILNKNWVDAISTVVIFLLMLVPSILKQRYSMYMPFELDLAIVGFVFLTLFLGSLRDFYELFPLWDGVLHFQSGILLGIVGFTLVYTLNGQKAKKLDLTPGFISFFAITFSLAMSVVWEIYEYWVDTLFGYTMQESGLPDTMGDMTVNAVGALIVAIFGYLWIKRRERIPFTPRMIRKLQYEPTHRQSTNKIV